MISNLRSRERLAQKEEMGIWLGTLFEVFLDRLLLDLRGEAFTLLLFPLVLLEREARLPDRVVDDLRVEVFVFFLWAISVCFWYLKGGIRRNLFFNGSGGAFGPHLNKRIPPGLQANYSTNGLYYRKTKG